MKFILTEDDGTVIASKNDVEGFVAAVKAKEGYITFIQHAENEDIVYAAKLLEVTGELNVLNMLKSDNKKGE